MKKILFTLLLLGNLCYAAEDIFDKLIENNKKFPTRQYTLDEMNTQYYTDYCLNDVMTCIDMAYKMAISGEYGNKVLVNGYPNIILQQQLQAEIANFYLYTYRERWRKGYYLEANPYLWQFKKPN